MKKLTAHDPETKSPDLASENLVQLKALFPELAASDVHNGYFSIDKKKVGNKTVEVFKDTKGTTQADDDTYSLIM